MRTERLNIAVFNFVKVKGHSASHTYSVDLHHEYGKFYCSTGIKIL